MDSVLAEFNISVRSFRRYISEINIFLNNLDYRNYIKGHEQNRNIQIGGQNG
mgnify:CR=1 FL=1